MLRKKSMLFSYAVLFVLILNMKNSFAANDTELNYICQLQAVMSDSSSDKSNLQNESTAKILSELFADYLLIKNSLSDNDSVNVQTQAINFLESIQIKSKELDKSTVPRNWELFMKYAPEAKSRIAATNSLVEQRFFFGVLSNYIIELIKTYGMTDKTVFTLKCKDKSIFGAGEWLSDLNDGKNPFLGPGNENCIEVIATKMY